MSVPVVIVRVYITESRARLKRLLRLLRESNALKGATVFRAIAGFGSTTPEGADASEPTDLPIVIEFFDSPTRAPETVRFIKTLIAPHHVIVIPATSI